MADIKERVTAMVGKVTALKERRNAADALEVELQKEKDKLPASARAALIAYGKKKKKP